MDVDRTEALALRAYLQKGGFLIVDDFKVQGFGGGFGNGGGGWPVFEENMKRVLPGVRFYEMNASHPIYHTFFEIPSLDIVPAGVQRRPAHLSRGVRRQRSERSG